MSLHKDVGIYLAAIELIAYLLKNFKGFADVKTVALASNTKSIRIIAILGCM